MPKLKTDIEIAAATSIGAATSWVVSNPGSAVNKKLPEKEIKNIELSPFFGIKEKNKVIHIHHWMFISAFVVSLAAIGEPVKGKRFINGFLLGLIIQGLSYNDRFKIETKVKN